jgi:hypothetical protein
MQVSSHAFHLFHKLIQPTILHLFNPYCLPLQVMIYIKIKEDHPRMTSHVHHEGGSQKLFTILRNHDSCSCRQHDLVFLRRGASAPSTNSDSLAGQGGAPAPSTNSDSFTGQTNLAWDPPDISTDVTGYMIHYGTASGSYSQSIDVGNTASYTVSNLTHGQTYYFAATAYNAAGYQSIYSNEVSIVMDP